MIWLRAGVYLNKSLGTTERVFQDRPWEQLKLSDILRNGVPTDAAEYAEYKRTNAPVFLFPLGHPPQVPESLQKGELQRQPSLAQRVDLLRAQRSVYFFHQPSSEKIDWYRNPFGPGRSDPEAHFSQLLDFHPEQGDLRTLWEPSRAVWSIDCAKAMAAGEYEDIGNLYWGWLDSWMNACPPYQGIHWKCGQESSVRLLSLLIGFWAVANDPTTKAARFEQIGRLAWATGYRIYHHIQYAISQKNNHAIFEAVGLMLIGHLFPEFKCSARWERLGRRVLEQEVLRQAYLDGSYLQHSMNYQRVMMQGALLGLRLAELAEKPFSSAFYERLGLCADFMLEMLDPTTGQTPQYGNNDGALILPFNECAFEDFRPVVQATHFAVHGARCLPEGPWDEDLLWLFGKGALETKVDPCTASDRPLGRAFDDGGYYTLRQTESWSMLRCHTYRDRPAHCDPLHLDLWWKGINLLKDCGTFQYFVPGRPDLEYYFKSIASHNTVQIDGEDPFELTSRFLWFPWPRGFVRRHVVSQSISANTKQAHCLEAEHYGYDRPPWNALHRRSVIALGHDWWVIVDDLFSRTPHQMVLRWHLADLPLMWDSSVNRASLRTDLGEVGICLATHSDTSIDVSVIRGRDEPNRVQGLASAYYGQVAPIPVLEWTSHVSEARRCLTAVGPGVARASLDQSDRSEPTEGEQQWIISSPERSYCLRLARLHRSVGEVYLRHDEKRLVSANDVEIESEFTM